MRRYVIDAHIHTIASGHAYSTVEEIVNAAVDKNLEMVCLTDHGPALEGAPGNIFFGNLRVIPPVLKSIKILKGIEANILNVAGDIDVPKRALKRLEIIGASLHAQIIKPGSKDENTEAVLGAVNNPHVDFLCHLGNPQYALDYEAILTEVKRLGKLIEINNSSAYVRSGSAANCIAIAKRCKALGIGVILGSDSHFSADVGNFVYADRVLELADFPDELIISLETKRLINYLEGRGKKLMIDPRDYPDEVLREKI